MKKYHLFIMQNGFSDFFTRYASGEAVRSLVVGCGDLVSRRVRATGRLLKVTCARRSPIYLGHFYATV